MKRALAEEGNIMELEMLLGQPNLTPKEKQRVTELMAKVRVCVLFSFSTARKAGDYRERGGRA